MSTKKIDISKSITPDVSQVYNISKTTKEATKETLNKFIEEETKLVKGIFQCFETPGATVKIIFRKYPGVPMFSKHMTDGQVYEVPLYVARHLNGTDVTAGALADLNHKNPYIGTCSYPVHGFKSHGDSLAPSTLGFGGGGEQGIPVPIVGITKRVKRYGFQSLEFAHGAA